MLVAGIRRNRFATFVGVDTDLTCVHMAALNCLVRNANTWIVHGNSLSLESWGGYHVRRSPFGGELHRLKPEEAARIIRLSLAKREASTALSPAEAAPMPRAPSPTVQEPSPEAKAAFEETAQRFTVDKKGQGDFGF